MEINQEIQKKLASEWFRFLQRKICEEFQYKFHLKHFTGKYTNT